MPMSTVEEGDLVRVTILNRTLADHPTTCTAITWPSSGRTASRLPGARGAATLNVAPDEQDVVTFRADNPGMWMDHCHNLDHAEQGYVMQSATWV